MQASGQLRIKTDVGDDTGCSGPSMLDNENPIAKVTDADRHTHTQTDTDKDPAGQCSADTLLLPRQSNNDNKKERDGYRQRAVIISRLASGRMKRLDQTT